MTSVKVCSRENCPATSVNAEYTAKCSNSNCAAMLHLPCIGITLKVQQLNSPNIKIFCNKCANTETSVADMNASFSANSSKNTPKKPKYTNESIVIELISLRNAVENNALKLTEINEKTTDIHTKTDSLVAKAKQSSFAPNIQSSMGTPKTTKKNNNANPMKTPSTLFSSVVRDSQPSAKRSRSENTPTEMPKVKLNAPKFIAPKPKVGTKVTATGLSAAPKREPKPKLTKSVWVGGLEKHTTEADIIDHIIENTPIVNMSQMKVHSLVKKGKDVEKLNFVSFKVDVSEEHFEAVMNVEIWPVDTEVREFINRNKTLGDFFPAMNPQNEQKNRAAPAESMDTAEVRETQQQQQTNPPGQILNQTPSATQSRTQSPSN